MQPTSLDDQIKVAEIEKIKAETAKTKLEQKKIQFELDLVRREDTKSWYITKEFYKFVISVVFGVAILGFYMQWVIEPTVNIKNLQIQRANEETIDSIRAAKKKLKATTDSLNGDREKLKLADKLYKSEKLKSDSIAKTSNLLAETNQKLTTLLNDKSIDKAKVASASKAVQKLSKKLQSQSADLSKIHNNIRSINLAYPTLLEALPLNLNTTENQVLVRFNLFLSNQIYNVPIAIYKSNSLEYLFKPLKVFQITSDINSTTLPPGDYELSIESKLYQFINAGKLGSQINEFGRYKFTVENDKSEQTYNIYLKNK